MFTLFLVFVKPKKRGTVRSKWYEAAASPIEKKTPSLFLHRELWIDFGLLLLAQSVPALSRAS
jgi:hypothetical protein